MKQTFTRGPVESSDREWNTEKPFDATFSINAINGGWHIANVLDTNQYVANAALIVAAFNSATVAQDMGFDGIKAIEALPKLLEALKMAESRWRDLGEIIRKQGSYSNDGFCTATADRCAEALRQAGQLTKAQENALAVGEQKPRW